MNMELKSFIKGGVEYYKLFAPCPKCCELGHHICPPRVWICGECGGDVYVGSNAHLFCLKCEKDFKLVFAHFECPDCRHNGFENIVNFDCRIPHSYPALAYVATYNADLKWSLNLIKELNNQP